MKIIKFIKTIGLLSLANLSLAKLNLDKAKTFGAELGLSGGLKDNAFLIGEWIALSAILVIVGSSLLYAFSGIASAFKAAQRGEKTSWSLPQSVIWGAVIIFVAGFVSYTIYYIFLT